jgi:DNA replication protein DnaC
VSAPTRTRDTMVPVAGVPAAPAMPEDVQGLLHRLRRPHIRAHAPDIIATAKAQRWEPIEVLRALLTEEAAGRERSALATRRAGAGFPTGKTFDAWNPSASSIPAPTQHALQTLEWVHRRENLVVCGPSGTGKTFLLEALGQHAVEQGLRGAWFTLEDLGTLLRRHRADDFVTKAIARVLRADLVVVDLCGYPHRSTRSVTSPSTTTQRTSSSSSPPATRPARSWSPPTCPSAGGARSSATKSSSPR